MVDVLLVFDLSGHQNKRRPYCGLGFEGKRAPAIRFCSFDDCQVPKWPTTAHSSWKVFLMFFPVAVCEFKTFWCRFWMRLPIECLHRFRSPCCWQRYILIYIDLDVNESLYPFERFAFFSLVFFCGLPWAHVNTTLTAALSYRLLLPDGLRLPLISLSVSVCLSLALSFFALEGEKCWKKTIIQTRWICRNRILCAPTHLLKWMLTSKRLSCEYVFLTSRCWHTSVFKRALFDMPFSEIYFFPSSSLIVWSRYYCYLSVICTSIISVSLQCADVFFLGGGIVFVLYILWPSHLVDQVECQRSSTFLRRCFSLLVGGRVAFSAVISFNRKEIIQQQCIQFVRVTVCYLNFQPAIGNMIQMRGYS